ncbi:hypothetical protein [Chlamydiifrater volucris]|uniref:hypothetical protein n=1 Tax=Chlamydiifrater volucris TaxID=2681470 RepID=UPI0032B100A1
MKYVLCIRTHKKSHHLVIARTKIKSKVKTQKTDIRSDGAINPTEDIVVVLSRKNHFLLIMDNSVAYLFDSLAANIEDFYCHVEKTIEALDSLTSIKQKKISSSPEAIRPKLRSAQQVTSSKNTFNPLQSPLKNEATATSYSPKFKPKKAPVYNGTNWELSLSPIDPIDDIASLSFSSLKDKTLSELAIPCAIFSHREDCEEVVFISRLAKVITQRLFPARCVFVRSADTFKQLLTQHSLALLSPSVTQQYFPSTLPHVSLPYDKKSLIIPIYSSEEYSNNTGLKKDLWAILSKSPFVNMLK